jgi:hypothetical protein
MIAVWDMGPMVNHGVFREGMESEAGAQMANEKGYTNHAKTKKMLVTRTYHRS